MFLNNSAAITQKISLFPSCCLGLISKENEDEDDDNDKNNDNKC